MCGMRVLILLDECSNKGEGQNSPGQVGELLLFIE